MVELLTLTTPAGEYAVHVEMWAVILLLPAVATYVLSRSWQRKTVHRTIRTVEEDKT